MSDQEENALPGTPVPMASPEEWQQWAQSAQKLVRRLKALDNKHRNTLKRLKKEIRAKDVALGKKRAENRALEKALQEYEEDPFRELRALFASTIGRLWPGRTRKKREKKQS